MITNDDKLLEYMDTSAFRTVTGAPVTAVTAEEMRAVDRVATDALGIDLLQMMENAGRTLAGHASDLARRPASARSEDGERGEARTGAGAGIEAEDRTTQGGIVVLAGNGGNGGGGIACARHLANHGVAVEIVLDRDPIALDGVAATQHGVASEMGVQTATENATDRIERAAVVVDALVGYGLDGAAKGRAATLIETANDASGDVLSLDVPSGVNATTGERAGPAARPDRTVTLALPKTGLEEGPDPLFLADISVPAAVYRRLDIEYESPFWEAYSIELRRT